MGSYYLYSYIKNKENTRKGKNKVSKMAVYQINGTGSGLWHR